MTCVLVPCASCSRHVKAGEARCPFCGAPGAAAAAPARLAVGASRAARLVAGGGTLLATAACSPSTPTDRDAEPPDAFSTDAPLPDGTVDAPSIQPAYGVVIFPDASIDSTDAGS